MQETVDPSRLPRDRDLLSRRVPRRRAIAAVVAVPGGRGAARRIRPRHRGARPVPGDAARSGILVSACPHGLLRVTRLGGRKPEPLYGLGGYKAWIGNICIDAEGKRLLSDSRDDVIVVHKFSGDEDEEEEKQ